MLCGRVREISLAVVVGIECQHEAVGESLVLLLGAVVDSPFERGNLGDFCLQGAEGFLDFFYLWGTGPVLEFKSDNMPKGGFFHCGIGRQAGDSDADDESEKERENFYFHDGCSAGCRVVENTKPKNDGKNGSAYRS